MDGVSAFFVQNIGSVYFFYGLAFFAMGLLVWLESFRPTEFRFGRALLPLALFGLIHGSHEWFEMFQIFAAPAWRRSHGCSRRVISPRPVGQFFPLFVGISAHACCPTPKATLQWPGWLVALIAGLWLAALAIVFWRFRPTLLDGLAAGDVLARYGLAIPGAVLAGWALMRERRDFHARGMSQYGRSLLWAALAFFVYGVLGQVFTRPSLVFPSQTINTALFLRMFGVPRAGAPHGCRHRDRTGAWQRAARLRAGKPDPTGPRKQSSTRGTGRRTGCPGTPRCRGGGAQRPAQHDRPGIVRPGRALAYPDVHR